MRYTRLLVTAMLLLALLTVSGQAFANDYVLKAEHAYDSASHFWTLNGTGYTDQTWLVASDFECTNSEVEINGADWWMGSQYGATLGDVQSFDITFYDDASGQPGSVRRSYSVTDYSADHITEISWGSGPNGDLYKFGAGFDETLSQVEGTRYWLSVVANVDYTFEDKDGNNNGQWRPIEGEAFGEWHYADRPDDEPTGWLTYADYSSDYEFDMAANVRGTPELPPSALLLLGAFPLGLAYYRGRRREE